jgi:hypothetical protein
VLLQAIYSTEQLVAAGGIIVFLIAIVIWVAMGASDEESSEFFDRRKGAEEEKWPKPEKPKKTTLLPDVKAVKMLRGGAFIGNRMRFKAKVVNESEYTITDVTVHLVSYPRDALMLDSGDDDVRYAKIEPGAFRSPSFEFIPTQDCVKGEVVAGMSYIDYRGIAHSLTSRPYPIRAVCDLLIPDEISPEEFRLTLQDLHSGDLVVSVDEWTPETMYEKAQHILDDSNFHIVSHEIEPSGGVVQAKIEGWAKGKYTGKSVGVELLISGSEGRTGASCTIKVSGEDNAMIVPALEDLRSRLCTWLCPRCQSTLTANQVTKLRRGGVVECHYCGATIGR